MSSPRRRIALSFAQRVAIVVAFGAALWALWEWIEVEGWLQIGSSSLTTDYGPTGVVLNGATEMRTNVGLRLVVQLALIVVWLILSLWLLRSRSRRPAEGTELPPDE